MKKLLIVFFLFIFVFMTGCAKATGGSDESLATVTEEETPTVQVIEKVYKIDEVFPFRENAKYHFDGVGSEYSTYDVVVEFIKGNRMQTRTNNGGSETVKVYEKSDAKLVLLVSQVVETDKNDIIDTATGKGEILLKYPVVRGTSWLLPDNRRRYISDTNVSITTPLGKYSAVEVTTTEKVGTSKDYYAENIGLVKSVFVAEGFDISSTLGKIE